jgi:hypothetical protein
LFIPFPFGGDAPCRRTNPPEKARFRRHLGTSHPFGKNQVQLKQKCLMKTMKDQKDVYELINNIILEKLQEGTIPWKKNWNSFGPARNYITDKPYRGFNALFLGMMGAKLRFPVVYHVQPGEATGWFYVERFQKSSRDLLEKAVLFIKNI